ncbi:DUF411 domain-containing protein [Crenobacter intestini]|uniref:DUF411 domain-containing protein n=1 Tax=Crenobacter intestini TaxID=2563443 RepID=A0A4T0UWJ2_9NEIS|nr:DUF411 domain-containing protein [Crenobacter intestini]TIC83419.1 DUF411 domain-containing protein [Crenobacter intestini]
MKKTSFAVALIAALTAAPAFAAPSGTMYKDPHCGCCDAWAKHMQDNGFKIDSKIDAQMSQTKDKLGVPGSLRSCHTAKIGNYLFEGHVPADLVIKVLRDKPAIAGLAVPGMPLGSPGMEGPTRQPYQVLTFDRQGRTTVYAQR